MSALGACSAAPLPSPVVPADTPVAAADNGSAGSTIVGADGGSQGAADSAGGSTSFQKLMNQAQAAEPAQAGNATAATATTTATPPVAGDKPAADAAAAVATALAADPLAQLLQLAGQASTAAGPAVVAPLTTGAARQVSSDSDADAAPKDDPLALVLASLAQAGITLQSPSPAASTTTPAASTGAAVAAAADSAVASLGSALPKSLTGVVDSLAARLRPGLAVPLPGAANSDSGTGSAPAASLLNLEPAQGNITLRDLLDGSGGDAASRARDPVELAAATRPADGAALQATAANDSTRAADLVTRTISVPVQHPRWAEAVSTQIRWFAEQGVQGATLRLTPEHLGPVEVRLSMSDNQVTVNFSAASAETRTALEQSLPRLREMLAGAGLSLGEAQVQQQMRQGSQNGFNSGGGTADTDVRDTLARVPMRLGLVDEYA